MMRKVIDESIFQVSKESRDRMNRVRRILRDHFITIADELKLSLNASVRAAQHNATLPPTERERRAEVQAATLATVRRLCAQAQSITGQTTTAPIERTTA